MPKRAAEGDTYVCQTWGYVMEKHKGKWIRQHRLRMERKLGRKLKRSEDVHHRNEIKTDNRLSNLRVWSKIKHRRYHSTGRCFSEQTKQKMRVSALRIATDPAERKRRSDRAKAQHAKGKLGRTTWSKEMQVAQDKRMQQLGSQSDAKHLKAHWKKPASRAKQSQQLRQHLAKNPGLRKAQAEARRKAGWWATHNQRVKLGEGRPKQKFAGK